MELRYNKFAHPRKSIYLLSLLLLSLLSLWLGTGLHITQAGTNSSKGNQSRTAATGSSTGIVYSSGLNASGQLGDGTTSSQSTPLLNSLQPSVKATSVAAGLYFSLAIGSDGKVYGWGSNSDGQLGDGTTTSRTSPVSISLRSGVTATSIATGQYHSLAIGSDSRVYAWGSNSGGQVGDGTTTNRTTPVMINLPPGVLPTAIAGGGFHSLAIGNDSKLYAWGDNSFGQLGDGTTTSRTSPVAVTLPGGVRPLSISAGQFFSMAVGSDGKVYGWGNNSYGQIGNGTSGNYYSSPVAVSLPGRIMATSIAAGDSHILATGSDNKLYAWGNNLAGQVGDSTTTSRNSPTIVALPSGIIPCSISASLNHSMAIGNDGKLYAWGDNSFGQLGDGTTTNRATPITIDMPDRSIPFAIAAGGYHSLVLTPYQPYLVTKPTDDGTGQMYGTLSYALSEPVTGPDQVTISFALTQGTTVTFTGSLTTTAKLKPTVALSGGIYGTSNRITIDGNRVAGDGLHLAGHNYLSNLTIEHFGGRELVLEGTGNGMQGVVVIAG